MSLKVWEFILDYVRKNCLNLSYLRLTSVFIRQNNQYDRIMLNKHFDAVISLAPPEASVFTEPLCDTIRT
jgi:hypothetical protein